MIILSSDQELTADQAAQSAQHAKDLGQGANTEKAKAEILLSYLDQIRAAHDLGEVSLETTCLVHELRWLAEELRCRGFQVNTQVHLMHGKLSIAWGQA